MQKYARVFLKGNTEQWVDFPLPQGDLRAFIAAIRMQGFIGPDGATQCYIPLDEIRMIMQVEGVSNVVHLTPVGSA